MLGETPLPTAGDKPAAALARLRMLSMYRRASDEALRAAAPMIQPSDCRVVIAAEPGFADWHHACRVLVGDGPIADFGDLLCFTRDGIHLNRWYVRYEEAVATREGREGYLLAYRRQFFVADRQFS